MVTLLSVLSVLNLVGGVIGFFTLYPSSKFVYDTPPAVLFGPSAAMLVSGVIGFAILAVIAEALEHLRAIRAKLVPTLEEPVPVETGLLTR